MWLLQAINDEICSLLYCVIKY